MAATQPVYALAMLGVTLSVAAGVLRGTDYLLQAPPAPTYDSPLQEPEAREPRLMIAFIAVTLLIGLMLSLFPGLVESPLRAVVSSYTFLSAYTH